MQAKKSYGQHFLHRRDLAQDIASAVSFAHGYTNLVEVGPGMGMLTQFLLVRSPGLYAAEADPDMVVYLKKHYPQLGERLISGDFLQMDFKKMFPDGAALGIVGNFPYNISSQIVIKMIENRWQVPELVGMFQKEVAERIVAKPGSKVYGIISVLAQAYYVGEYLFTVDKSAFKPPPQVQSGVIRLVRKDDFSLECDDALFKTVVKTAFGQRRKMLRNTMRGLLGHIKGLLDDPFYTKRPEQLSVAEFVKMTQLVSESRVKE